MSDLNLEQHPIVIFSTPSCGFCTMVKSYLSSKKIDFHELDLTTDQEALLWLQENVGQTGVPVILFQNKDIVVGWQRNLIDHYLTEMNLL